MSHQKPQFQPQNTQFSLLLSSSFTGILRGLAGLPFQHPFDIVKTHMQAFQTNFRETFTKIYQLQGFKGFYSGFIVNSLRVASKQIYRWPLQIGLLGYLNQNFSHHISRTTSGILCGIAMATIQVAIICPFQKLKVWMMTKRLHKGGILSFFKTFPFSRLFDGIYPVFLKQMLSWVSFVGATEFLKDLAYEITKKDRKTEDLDAKQIFLVSMGVALINTFFIMPADCIKTHYQQFRSEDNKPANHKKLMDMTKQIYKNYGMKGFFKGWESRLIQYNINGYFTVVMMESILKKYELLLGSKRKKVQ